MKQNKKYDEEKFTIDLVELFYWVFRKLHIIILLGIIFALIVFTVTKTFITPKYDSVTKIYVISKQDENTVTNADLMAGEFLTKDYIEMVKSRPVMEKVIAKFDLNFTAEQLAKTIIVETPPDTRIIQITVRNEDPKLAKQIADEVREVASEQIRVVMNIDAVNTVEEANLPTKKAAPDVMINTLIGGVLGMVLSAGFIMISHLLDDSIKTPDDVEKYLDLNVLASIPIKEGEKNAKRVKGKGRRK